MATASGVALPTASRRRDSSSCAGDCKTRPSLAVLSFAPKRSSRGTSGETRSKKKSYNRGRAWRPISITSSNPAVVISATRAPLRCSSALVPTVVPCKSVNPAATPIFWSASAMARDGSSGVENTFNVLSTPPDSHTQSVKVPPVSIAIRTVGRAGRGMKKER